MAGQPQTCRAVRLGPTVQALSLPSLRLPVVTLSLAVLGIGVAGAARQARVPDARLSSVERTSGGSVGHLIPRVFFDDEREGVRRTLRMRESGTYISEILRARDSALARWPNRESNPLRVWIDPDSRVPDWHEEYVRQVRNAFVAWDTLKLPVRFVMEADSGAADIHVTWIDRFGEQISGRTRWARDENYWITDASIVLAVHHRNGDLLEDDAMHAMALHEIGHLLGLDHTSDISSVMAPKVRVRSLSEPDRATARLLYSLPAGPVHYSSR